MPSLSQLFHPPNPTYNRAMSEGYLTTKQAAERLGFPEQTVRNLTSRGMLNAEVAG